MAKKAKKKKIRRPKIQLSEKQIKRLKEEIVAQTCGKTLILSVAAMADELNLTEEQIGNVAKRLDRYAGYLEDHTVRLNEVADIIEKKTGIKFGRF